MTTPLTITTGLALFIPNQGIYAVTAITAITHAGTEYQQCTLKHRFSERELKRNVNGLARDNVREPTQQSTAVDILQRLKEPSRSPLTGPWQKKQAKLDALLKEGTLEKNLRALRHLHRLDEADRGQIQTDYYNRALQYVIEELSHIFREPLYTTKQTILRTLNNTAFRELHQ